MNVVIQLISANPDTGPFNLYSDSDVFTTPFATGISRSALLAGYSTSAVPSNATIIRVTSTGTCQNSVNMPITGVSTTTTTTGTPTTTTTTTTPPILCFVYNGQNNNSEQATIFWTNCDGTSDSEVVNPGSFSSNFCAREGSVAGFGFTINLIEPCGSPVTTTTTSTTATPTTTTTTTVPGTTTTTTTGTPTTTTTTTAFVEPGPTVENQTFFTLN